ncbi:cupin domain-containing protein [Streptomyces albus subsp. chlorinus]|uniref:cupin domain-containing protein n=1 Tax=Streptomyces albus TaxID=1888 RepID=UPI00156E52E5|nr:cupin domain-containing protein [Streptomyces albus]NSC21575.1 cupin domain-containing protein [Streptomyces albus subsp. chlorinus]
MNAERQKVSASDIEPNRRRGGDLRLTLGPRTVGSTSGFGGFLRLRPGEVITEHYHPYSEEFLHVTAGDMEMSLDGEKVALRAGDSLMVPIGVRHRLVNTGTTEASAVFHLSPLAPRPELGHVDTEQPVDSAQPHIPVGEAPGNN